MPAFTDESKPGRDLEILVDAERIARRVRELGAQISADYRGKPLRLVGILKGAWVFLADLIRQLDLDNVSVDFLGLASYGGAAESSGEVRITKDLDLSLEGIDVLVVEDILDTGETFHYLRGVLEAHRPKSLRLVTLLDKAARRTRPIRADYVGFTIPNAFVVATASTTLKITASFPTSEFSTLRPILGSTPRLDYAQLVSVRSMMIAQGGGRRDHEEGSAHYQQGPDHRAARNSLGTGGAAR